MSRSWTEADDNKLRELVALHGNQWSIISNHFPTRTPSQVASRWEKYLDPNLIKGAFTEEEDQLIIEFVSQYGPRCWQQVTQFVPMRSAKQCRERWFNHLDPSVKNTDWTPEEDQIIFDKHQELGGKWALISRMLPGRTDNSIKNRWNASICKRIGINEKGEEFLLPDPKKRKRRHPKQLASRPAPIKTLEIKPMPPKKQNTPPSQKNSPPKEMCKQIENYASDTNVIPIEISPFKTPSGMHTPINFSGFTSPNNPFGTVIITPPADEFIFEFLDSPALFGENQATPKTVYN